MLQSRITKWKLDKKHKHAEMRAAVRMLGSVSERWSAQEPQFLIRGRLVKYEEVIQYFRRRGIDDPTRWVRASGDISQEHPDVQLLPANQGPVTDHSQSEAFGSQRSHCNHQKRTTQCRLPGSGETRPRNADHGRGDATRPQGASQLTNEPSLPRVYEHGARAIWQMQSYCSWYLESGRDVNHPEPHIHQFTIHGRFGDRMQNGISLLLRGETQLAFDSFECGFGLLEDLLKDNHPMGLALYMSVLSELVSNRMQPLLRRLVAYTKEMAAICLSPCHPITSTMCVILSSEDQLRDLILSSMRVAVAYFDDRFSRSSWKTLYLKERFCDCLYHAKEFNEGYRLRSQLFLEQEAFYGKTARNVLWTLTNMADDYLLQKHLDDAEATFTEALARADGLTGFARAKIRFAALEGLAKTARSRAEELRSRETSSGATSPVTFLNGLCIRKLQEGANLLLEAEVTARTWFETTSRRTARVEKERLDVLAMISEMASDPESLST